jgi:hypothetical protein
MANTHLSNINYCINSINDKLKILNNLVGHGFSLLYDQLVHTNQLLVNILHELKIPETQRERRYHIEEGIKYFWNAIEKGDELYFDDALDAFTDPAIVIQTFAA